MPKSRFAELDALVASDAALREELISRGELFGGYHPEMEALQTEHGKKLESLIDEFGWPDAAIDGEAACKNAWLIVMHAISLPSLQRKVLAQCKKNPSGCTPARLAMLEDRTLVFSGKKQKFGTQFDWDANGELRPFPIGDEGNVDSRRTIGGLPSLEETAAQLRARASSEGDKPPANLAGYTRRREEWMLRVGWINDRAEINLAYSAYRPGAS